MKRREFLKNISIIAGTIFLCPSIAMKEISGLNTEHPMIASLIINQGANDDEILTFKSSDVSWGMTKFTETDTYGKFMKNITQ